MSDQDPVDPNWDGVHCATCGRADTPMWRMGPSGYKNLCNACGIRWRRMNGDLSEAIDIPQSRKTNVNEIGRSFSPKRNRSPFRGDKRSRTTQSFEQETAMQPKAAPKSNPIDIDPMEYDDLEGRLSDYEEWSPSGSNTPSIRIHPPSPGSAPNPSPFSIESIYNPPKHDCSSSPFIYSHNEVKIEKTIAKSPPKMAHVVPELRSASVDISLLREILTRLENLRKEHKKTTKQVERIMEECKTNPELFGDAPIQNLIFPSNDTGSNVETHAKVAPPTDHDPSTSPF